MSIAMLVPSYPEPSQTFFERQAEGLDAIIFTEKVRRDLKKSENISYHEIPYADHAFNSHSIGGMLRIIRNFLIYQNIDRMPKKEESAFRQLLKKYDVEVLIAQYGLMGLRAIKPCQAEGIPLIVHFHGFDLSSLYRYWIYRISCRKLTKIASACIVVNSCQRDRLLRLCCPSEKVYLIHCGVPIDEFPVTSLRDNRFCRFLAVGRMVEKKSPLDTIRSFSICASACEGVTLTYIGDGPLMNQAKQISRDLNITDKIFFLGERSNSFVREEMIKADVFVQHSVTASNGDEEGWPVAIAEAAASALPIVSTYHTGIATQVIHGKSGFLVQERSWKEMGKMMIKLANDKSLRQEMGRFGRNHMRNYGSIDSSIKSLKEVVSTTLRRPPDVDSANKKYFIQ